MAPLSLSHPSTSPLQKRWRNCNYYDNSCDRYRIAIISIIVLVVVLKILILFLLFRRHQKRKQRRTAGAKMSITYTGGAPPAYGNRGGHGNGGLSRGEERTMKQIRLSEGQMGGVYNAGLEKPKPAYSPEIVR